MATEYEIRSTVAAFLRTVPGIGTVHDRERGAEAREDASEFELVAGLLRQSDGEIRGAVVNQLRVREEDDEEIGRSRLTYTLGIVFALTYNDDRAGEASYEHLAALVEAAASVLRAARSLGFGVDDVEHTGLQRPSRPRVIGSERYGKLLVRPCVLNVTTYAAAGVC